MQFCIPFTVKMALADTPDNTHVQTVKNAQQGKWDDVLTSLNAVQDPLFHKLMTWLYLKESPLPIHFKTAEQFINRHPNWPHLGTLRLQAERNIPDTLKPYEIADWFNDNAPQTATGMVRYLDALITLGKPDQAKEKLKAFWKNAGLSTDETHYLAKKYARLLSQDDHSNRLDNMIWWGRYAEAKAIISMKNLVPADISKLGQARLQLAQNKSNVSKTIDAVPDHLKNDPSLIYERLRWRRRNDFDDRALEILFNLPKKTPYASKWWLERHIMIRRSMEDGNYPRAYALASTHNQKGGLGMAQAEFLAGWLSMQYLHKPRQGFKHFHALYKNVNSPISLSRATYWLGRAADKSGQDTVAQQWFTASSKYLPTYYGQLAQGMIPPQTAPHFPPTPALPNRAELQKFNQIEMVRVIRLIHQSGLDTNISDPFFSKLFGQAKTPADYKMISDLALEIGHRKQAVIAAKKLFYKEEMLLFNEGYPTLNLPKSAEKHADLIFGLIRQESLFDTHATSPVGARGLMQLMPATARDMAKKTGQRYSKDKLYDGVYNASLGSEYILFLLDYYDGSVVLSIAAYNAGMGRVNGWIKEFGDPRTSNIDIIDWVEHLPVYETRNYIQRVLEGMHMYQYRLSRTPKTILTLK